MLLLLFAIYNSNALPTPLPVRTDPLGALGHSSLPATSKAQSQPETLPALFIGRAMSQAAQEGAPLPLNHPQITQPIVQARPNGPDNIQFLGTTRDEIAANQASGSGRVAHIGTLPDGHRPMSPAGTQLQTPNPPTYHSLMYNSLRTVVDKLAERIVGNARMSTSLNGPHGHVGPLPPTAIDVRTTIRRQLLERLVHNLGQPDTLRRNPGSAQRIQQVKSLMEQALERSNARRGLQQVLQNAGSPAAAHQPATGTGGVSGTHARFQALTGDTSPVKQSNDARGSAWNAPSRGLQASADPIKPFGAQDSTPNNEVYQLLSSLITLESRQHIAGIKHQAPGRGVPIRTSSTAMNRIGSMRLSEGTAADTANVVTQKMGAASDVVAPASDMAPQSPLKGASSVNSQKQEFLDAIQLFSDSPTVPKHVEGSPNSAGIKKADDGQAVGNLGAAIQFSNKRPASALEIAPRQKKGLLNGGLATGSNAHSSWLQQYHMDTLAKTSKQPISPPGFSSAHFPRKHDKSGLRTQPISPAGLISEDLSLRWHLPVRNPKVTAFDAHAASMQQLQQEPPRLSAQQTDQRSVVDMFPDGIADSRSIAVPGTPIGWLKSLFPRRNPASQSQHSLPMKLPGSSHVQFKHIPPPSPFTKAPQASSASIGVAPHAGQRPRPQLLSMSADNAYSQPFMGASTISKTPYSGQQLSAISADNAFSRPFTGASSIRISPVGDGPPPELVRAAKALRSNTAAGVSAPASHVNPHNGPSTGSWVSSTHRNVKPAAWAPAHLTPDDRPVAKPAIVTSGHESQSNAHKWFPHGPWVTAGIQPLAKKAVVVTSGDASQSIALGSQPNSRMGRALASESRLDLSSPLLSGWQIAPTRQALASGGKLDLSSPFPNGQRLPPKGQPKLVGEGPSKITSRRALPPRKLVAVNSQPQTNGAAVASAPATKASLRSALPSGPWFALKRKFPDSQVESQGASIASAQNSPRSNAAALSTEPSAALTGEPPRKFSELKSFGAREGRITQPQHARLDESLAAISGLSLQKADTNPPSLTKITAPSQSQQAVKHFLGPNSLDLPAPGVAARPITSTHKRPTTAADGPSNKRAENDDTVTKQDAKALLEAARLFSAPDAPATQIVTPQVGSGRTTRQTRSSVREVPIFVEASPRMQTRRRAIEDARAARPVSANEKALFDAIAALSGGE